MSLGRYDDLMENWRRERENEALQSIPEKFYEEMTDYLLEIQSVGSQTNVSLSSRITEKEREYAQRMLRELTRLRMKKIVESELNGVVLAGKNLTREEQIFYSDLRRVLSSHEERLKSILMGHVPQIDAKPPQRADQKVVRFLQAVPAIMGIDMKTYGPFKPEDVVSLPVENAENLIRRGIAKEVEIPK